MQEALVALKLMVDDRRRGRRVMTMTRRPHRVSHQKSFQDACVFPLPRCSRQHQAASFR